MIFRKIWFSFVLIWLAPCFWGGCTAIPSPVQEAAQKTARLNIALGYGYIAQHKMELAKHKFLKALETAPELPETQDAMGHWWTQLGDFKQAEKHYLLALSLAPDHSSILNNFGAMLCRMGRYKEADVYFQKAVLNPLYAAPEETFENAGICAFMCFKSKTEKTCYAQAMQYFKKALSYDPTRSVSKDALQQLGRMRPQAWN